MTLAQSLNDHLPIGWRFTICLCLADDDWQINATNDEYVVVATGLTIEDALAQASTKIHEEKYAGRLNWLAHKSTDEQRTAMSGISLASLGLSQPLKLPRPSFAPPSSPATKA